MEGWGTQSSRIGRSNEEMFCQSRKRSSGAERNGEKGRGRETLLCRTQGLK